MSNTASPRRGPHRFEVRIQSTLTNGTAINEVKTRSGKLTIAMLAVMEICRLWAVADGAVIPGTRVLLVDTNDGAEIMSLRWHGFETNTLDGAVNVFRTNGFQLQEVKEHGQ